jgi:hypothetical protein
LVDVCQQLLVNSGLTKSGVLEVYLGCFTKKSMNMSLSIHVMSPNFVGDSSVYVSARHADFVVMVSKAVEEDDTKVVDEQHKPLSLFFFFFFFPFFFFGSKSSYRLINKAMRHSFKIA